MSQFHLTYSLPLYSSGRNIRLYPEDGTTIFLRNVDTQVQNYTSSKRKNYTSSKCKTSHQHSSIRSISLTFRNKG